MITLEAFIQITALVCVPSVLAYPIYGTKRYGRTTPRRLSPSSWNPYQQMIRTQRYPLNYYELYPYTTDDYYYSPQDSYPVYYPARTSKYEVYQAVLPYYYQDRPSTRPTYYGYADDELLQEAEREEREDSQPIGQEMLYENDNSNENLDDVNAAFLQNLIMSQMYKDAIDEQEPLRESEYEETYGKLEDVPKHYNRQEDEDVRELKQLAKLKTNKQNTDDIHWMQSRKYGSNNWDVKRAAAATGKNAPTTGAPTASEHSGQKEEVLARPATPVRHAFEEQERKRTPSVYDTIKHMLDMEKDLANKYEGVKGDVRKRIVTSEDSLTQQLSVLKKKGQ